MRHCLVAALLGLLAVSVRAAPTVILESAQDIPPGWSLHHNASASDKITLFVALKEPGIEQLKARLHQRHDPNHASFGHLSRDQVHQLRQPARATTSAVAGWLRSGGIRDVHTQGSLISFEASVQAVKSLFEADLAYYAYDGSDADPLLRALSYTVPAWLRDYIDFVHPITNFMPPRGRGGRRGRPKPKPRPGSWHWQHPKPTKSLPGSATPTSRPIGIPTLPAPQEPNLPCLTATLPDCIKDLYNITYNATAPSPVRFGVAGFLEQWILYSDVAEFMDIFAPQLTDLNPPYNFSVELLNGGTNPQDSLRNAGIEASLDVEYAMGLGYPTNVVYYVTGGRGVKLNATTGEPLPPEQSDNEPYLEFLTELLAKDDDDLPHVLSISYADDELGVPRAYAVRVCDMFAALTARGVSVFVATGDGGAAGTGQTDCVSNDGEQRRMYVPTFPGSCPYVTSVGATDNVAPPITGEYFSAGGFSDFFERPEWQDEVVLPYLEGLVSANDPRLPLFNRSGRAMPDISAIGSGFQIIMGGVMSQVLGTSASTPTIAAMVALVNDARMRAGKPSLGWLNPLLYSAKVRSVLTDVTVGNSSGCDFPDGSFSPGWSSIEGYDCVTGLGVVNDFNDFMAALL
ncbi:Tripeptidyl-peptidase sed2 [Madurella mycetomatis]|uniref:tripeptidyl-peptidase II n=1 Tax=Madurella mycetomatis TaxID=100816 RepID=A0A175W253_9PEZI|nr:Tripeptidyl-peptidase sed2 [Madurella mycetomatis]